MSAPKEPGCGDTAGAQGNVAAFKLEATEPGAYLEAQQGNTYVYIAQEKGPEVSFNETASEIEVEKGVKRLNALYGGGAWLGPYTDTAFEVKAHDPGVGIAWARVGLGSEFNLYEPIYEGGKCNGVQCKEDTTQRSLTARAWPKANSRSHGSPQTSRDVFPNVHHVSG
jgi:hypothetical protein